MDKKLIKRLEKETRSKVIVLFEKQTDNRGHTQFTLVGEHGVLYYFDIYKTSNGKWRVFDYHSFIGHSFYDIALECVKKIFN